MPDENPYAAPQTIDLEIETAPLPLAESRLGPPRRRIYVEWETARLKFLAHRSQAIDDMQVVWLTLCFIAIFGGVTVMFPIFLLTDNYAMATGFLVMLALAIARLINGFTRSIAGRRFALAVDSLLGICCLVGMLMCVRPLFASEGGGRYFCLLGLLILTLIGYPTYRCLRAMYLTPELFGPKAPRHEDLNEELHYRQVYDLM